MNVRIEKKYNSTEDPGIIKYILRLSDGNYIESVLIPYKDHLTLCASTQVGCPVKCRFCRTGKDKFIRNLKMSEIVDQVRVIGNDISGHSNIDIVAFMGMGEPLLNYNNVVKSVRALKQRSPWPIKHFFISTVGIVPKLLKLSKEKCLNINLFISLNATEDRLRRKMMPVRPYYSINQIFDAVDLYSKRVRTEFNPTISYLLLNRINDSRQDAKRIVKLISGGPYTVYLKEYCENDKLEFKRSNNMKDFKKILDKAGIINIANISKGKDVLAGCGQLRHRFLQAQNPA